jgi:hypothetical protein
LNTSPSTFVGVRILRVENYRFIEAEQGSSFFIAFEIELADFYRGGGSFSGSGCFG